jgi:hypothetical protein
LKKLSVLLCLSLFLCACSATNSKISPICHSVSFNAEINYQTEPFDFFVTINDNGETHMENRQDGYIIEFSEMGVNFKYGDLVYKTELTALPDDFKLDLIHTIFSDISKSKPMVISKNDSFFVEGETEKYKYKVFFGLSGLPLEIIEKNNNISIIISNAKVI